MLNSAQSPIFFVLLAAITAIGHISISNMVENEQIDMLEQVNPPSDGIITGENFSHLLPIVQAWLRNSGVPGKPDVTFARLNRRGGKSPMNWDKFQNTILKHHSLKQPRIIHSYP